MASGTLGALSVDLLLETVNWIAGLNKAEAEAKKSAEAMAKSFNDLNKKVEDSLKHMAAGMAAAFGAHEIYDWIKGATEAADAMNTLSQKTGLTISTLTQLDTYAKVSGTSVDAVSKSVVKLDVAMIAAQDSTSEQAAAFKDLGVNVMGKTADQVFADVVAAFGKMEDGANKTQAAVKIFGKAGADLIPVFNAMNSASGEAKTRTKEHGDAVQVLAEQYEKFVAQQSIAHERSATMATMIAQQFVPYLTELVKTFNDAAKSGSALNGILTFLVNGIKGVIIVVDALVTGLTMASTLVGGFAKALYLANIGDIDGAWKALTGSMSSVNAQQDQFKSRITALVDPLANVTGEVKKQVGATDGLGAGWQKQTDQSKKLEENYQRLIKTISEKTAVDEVENASGQKLTEGGKMALKIMADIQSGTLQLTDARKKDLVIALEQMITADRRKEALKNEALWLEYLRKKQDEYNKSSDANQKIIDETLNAWEDADAEAEFALSIMGKTTQEQERLTANRKIDLEVKQKIAALDRSVGLEELQRQADIITAEGEAHKQRIANYAGAAEAVKRYNAEVESLYGDLFKGIESLGENAFTNLFDSTAGGWKKMLSGMAADFKKMLMDFIYKQLAKPLLLNLVAMAPGGLGQMGASALAAPGGSGLWGSFGGGGFGGGGGLVQGGFGLMNSAGGYPAYMSDTSQFAGGAAAGSGYGMLATVGYGVAGGLAGYGAARLYGAGARGQQNAASYGATGAALGSAFGPLGALAGWGIGTIAGIATDPDPDAMRKGTFGAMAGAKGPTQYSYTSKLGTFGISDTKWFSDSDMGEQLKAFMASMKTFDDSIAASLPAADVDKLKARLADLSKQYEFGMEHTDVSGLGEIIKDRIKAVIETVAPEAADFFSTFKGGVDELTQSMAGYLAIKGGLDFDPAKIVAAAKAQQDLQNNQMMAYQNQIGALHDLTASWDGSAESTTAMAGALADFQAATVQMIESIDKAADAMHTMFAATEDSIRMSTMTDEQKYNFLQNQSAALMDQLSTETDPAKIQELAGKINDDINAAWGLLSDDQKQKLSAGFLERLDALDAAVADKMNGLRDVVTEDSDSMMSTIASKMDAIFTKGEDAADKNVDAAEKQLEAALAPRTVVIALQGDAGIVTSAG